MPKRWTLATMAVLGGCGLAGCGPSTDHPRVIEGGGSAPSHALGGGGSSSSGSETCHASPDGVTCSATATMAPGQPPQSTGHKVSGGYHCTFSTECDVGLSCSASTHVCETAKKTGDPCLDDMECAIGLSCVTGICQGMSGGCVTDSDCVAGLVSCETSTSGPCFATCKSGACNVGPE